MSSSTNNDMQNKSNHAIIEPRPDCRLIVERTARLVSKKGVEMEWRIRNCNVNNEKFNFLKTSDPCHAFYQQKLIEYRQARNQEPDAPLVTPHRITLKEHAILMLTAQFVSRYGMSFFELLIEKAYTNPQLEFIKFSRCHYFIQLVVAYSRVLRPSKKTDGGASTETLVQGFIEQIQILLEKQDDGVEIAMSDFDAVVEDQESFANVPLPDHLLMGMSQLLHQEGEPNRQLSDDDV